MGYIDTILCSLSQFYILQALTVSNDGDYIIIGGFSGRAYVLHTHTLNVEYIYDSCDTSIRSLHISDDNRLAMG